MGQSQIRVHLADGDYFLRLGLERLLSTCPDIKLEQITDTGDATVQAALQGKPDLVLMETSLDNVCSMDAIRQITMGAPGTRVVVLSSVHDIETMSRARSAGACSYLAKSAISTDLGTALRLIHWGNMIFSKPTDADQFPPHAANRHDLKSQLLRQTSPRDRQILQSLSEGLTNAQIALQQHVSEGTVKATLARIMDPLGVNNRVQLAVLAVQAGLLDESRIPVPRGVGPRRHATPRA